MASGRLPSLTQEVSAAIVEAVRNGSTFKLAAETAGISERTMARWMSRGRKESDGVYWLFWQAVKKAHADLIAENVNLIRTAAKEPKHWTAAAWLAERLAPDQYGDSKARIRELEKRLNEAIKLLEKLGGANVGPDRPQTTPV